MKIIVKTKNGWEGYLNKDVHVIFTKSDLDEGDHYSYTVPCEDIVDIRIEEE